MQDGVFNHTLYFNNLYPKIHITNNMNFINAINNQFGSIETFLKQLKETSLSVFGSGYAYVVLNRNGSIMIIKNANQDTPLELNLYPLMPIDVWEHAYYLKHKNKRADYIDDLFEVINWDNIEKIYNDFFMLK